VPELHGDPEVARVAHKLSGLAAQFGEAELAAAADALETACRNGDARDAAITRINGTFKSWGEAASASIV